MKGDERFPMLVSLVVISILIGIAWTFIAWLASVISFAEIDSWLGRAPQRVEVLAIALATIFISWRIDDDRK